MSDTDHAKTQLREHLASLIVSPISEGFWSIQKNAIEMCERNKQPNEGLRTFQNMLTKIPEWSDTIITEETDRILKKTKCTYMDDLLMGVFLSYMKSFASLQYRGKAPQLKVEFEKPNVSKFIKELYIHCARKFWKLAYLFKTSGIPSEQQSKNRQEIEDVVYKTIDDVVRSFLPWEVIAKNYFTEVNETPSEPPSSKSVLFEDLEDSEDEVESESEEEPEPETKKIHFTDDSAMDITLETTNLDEKKEEERNPLEEIEKNVSDESLVLNL
jgi:hypothetical protein